DAALAAVVFLAWTERRRAVRPALVVLAAGAVPVLVGALAAGDLGRWWFAVVGYRGEGDSIVTGSLVHRLDLLQQSLPAVAKGLGLLALLALAGWRRSPLLVRLWLGAAALGVVGGGNFHPHYYLQLVPPLAVLAGAGVERLLRARLRLAAAVCAAAAAGTVAVTAPLWFAGGSATAPSPATSSATRGRATRSCSSGPRPTSTTSPTGRPPSRTCGAGTWRRSRARSATRGRRSPRVARRSSRRCRASALSTARARPPPSYGGRTA